MYTSHETESDFDHFFSSFSIHLFLQLKYLYVQRVEELVTTKARVGRPPKIGHALETDNMINANMTKKVKVSQETRQLQT